MKTLTYDLDYLCTKMTDLASLPIRVISNDSNKVFFTSEITYDPFDIDKQDAFKKSDRIYCYHSYNGSYYGIVNNEKAKIIIGPSRDNPYNDQEIRDLAFKLNVKNNDLDNFNYFLKSINLMSIDSILQICCTINHLITGEKIQLSDIKTQKNNYQQDNSNIPASDRYKSYLIEKEILNIVKNGDINALDNLIHNAPTVKAGKLSFNQLRNKKNAFIVTTTLIARGAIEAGMSIDDSFRLSDIYIQQCENCYSDEELTSLNIKMVYDYTREISRINKLAKNSKLAKDVYNYIIHHLSSPIKTTNIAEGLYISRSYLSTTFKKETGIDLNHYIDIVKIDIAKQLLEDNSKSLLQISDYLGYSSYSHFSKVFKEITNIPPKQYRKIK